MPHLVPSPSELGVVDPKELSLAPAWAWVLAGYFCPGSIINLP